MAVGHRQKRLFHGNAQGRITEEFNEQTVVVSQEISHEELFRNEEVALVGQAINRLKPEYREVVVLREYDNLSYREIAEVVGVAENMVRSRLYSARRLLYEMLKNDFIGRTTT